jgi:hypothetical protein
MERDSKRKAGSHGKITKKKEKKKNVCAPGDNNTVWSLQLDIFLSKSTHTHTHNLKCKAEHTKKTKKLPAQTAKRLF